MKQHRQQQDHDDHNGNRSRCVSWRPRQPRLPRRMGRWQQRPFAALAMALPVLMAP